MNTILMCPPMAKDIILHHVGGGLGKIHHIPHMHSRDFPRDVPRV